MLYFTNKYKIDENAISSKEHVISLFFEVNDRGEKECATRSVNKECASCYVNSLKCDDVAYVADRSGTV